MLTRADMIVPGLAPRGSTLPLEGEGGASRRPPRSRAAPVEAASPAIARVWFDGELVDADGPRAGVTTHALHYGSGVFEGIRAYATRDGAAVFRLADHLERMRKGATLLGIAVDPDVAAEAVVRTLRANGHRDAYVRPLAWVGAGSFGLDVAGHAQHFMVATTPTPVHLGGARTRLGVSRWRRNPARALPPLKLCGGYVNSILAKREAKARGCDEALFVDDDGFVVECTGANVFAVSGDRIVAVEHADALPGITRDTLVATCGAECRPMSLAELRDADEVFVCGTAAEVTPIAALEEREYGVGPVTREIAALYARLVRGLESMPAAWLATA